MTINNNQVAIPEKAPIIVLDDTVIFPNIVIPIFVADPQDVAVVRWAVQADNMLFIAMRKQTDENSPNIMDQIFTAGSLVNIIRVIELSDGRIKLLVQGTAKVKVNNVVVEPVPIAMIEIIEDAQIQMNYTILQASLRGLKEKLETLISLGRFVSPDMMMIIEDIQDPGRMADVIASNMSFKANDLYAMVVTKDPLARLAMVDRLLENEIEIIKIQIRIQNKAKEEMSSSQREYYLREQIKIIKGELGENDSIDDEVQELRKKAEQSNLPESVSKLFDKQINKLARMQQDAAEAVVTRNYVEWILDVPWSKLSQDSMDLKRVQEVLDEDHFGLEKVKDRIVEHLAVNLLTGGLRSPIICLVGPPGVGKTSLGKSVARAMNREFVRISLGGLKDESEIRGHRRTYVGAMPGKIIHALKKAQTLNPVIMLDEIDKMANDNRGDPSSALLEVLDPEQNSTFMDHYMNVEVDLSKCLFIANANTLETISPPLLDRMEVIELNGYSEHEKVQIANRFLLPKLMNETGLKDTPVTFDNTAIIEVINHYTQETGLRSLEKKIGQIMRKLARKKAVGEELPTLINSIEVKNLIGERLYEFDWMDIKDSRVGMVTGLAWTRVGGEVMFIECNKMKGKGDIQLTGKLGDVMKESIMTAMSYLRSKLDSFHISHKAFSESDYHIHVPSGAIPKDGPSAGIAMCTSLISIMTGLPVRQDVAMTGEFTLHGRILPIGGLKEKLLAALRTQIRTVIVPSRNMKDVREIDKEITDELNIVFVDNIDQVLKVILVGYERIVDTDFYKEASRVHMETINYKSAS